PRFERISKKSEVVAEISAISEQDFTIDMRIQGFPNKVTFLIDTGADVTCISAKSVSKNLLSKFVPADIIIFGVDEKIISTIRMLNATFVGSFSQMLFKAYILCDGQRNLLGRPEIQKLGLLKTICNIQSDAALQTVLFGK
ncbi:hypothetical protein JGD51_25530, partial [Salmonella enterica subsp. enterica serovar Typhimurium]|nr:hypothetical protein [Salmonella enterica subsp. enterica serovar Typhimurium]